MRFSLIILFLFSLTALLAQANFTDVSSGNAIFSIQNGHGVSIADYDNDGDDDLLIASSPAKLLRNNGDFSFTDVTNPSGITGTCQVAVWFDANNDGWLDLYMASWTVSRFFKNNGNGTFTEIPSSTTGLLPANNQALLAGDLNGDGWIDLYCNNFNRPNQLYLNKGNFVFENHVAGSGTEISSLGMGGLLIDFDKDGDLDIYLVFDGLTIPNVLYKNIGNGKFQKVSEYYGLSVKGDGMGADVADFNHDGEPDFYITNLYHNACLISQPNGVWEDKASAYNVNDNGMGWGVVCLDYDNDTFTDVYINNEYNYAFYTSKLYRNLNGNGFSEVGKGTVLENKSRGFGVGSSDLNSDGKLDLIVVNYNVGGVKILRNNTSGGNWFELNLVGTTVNKFAVGARVEINCGGVSQFREVTAGSGYATQNSMRLHFGLGQSTVVDQITVHWPDGTVENFTSVPANKRYLAIQGQPVAEFNAASYNQALTNPGQIPLPPDLPNEEVPENDGLSIARLWNEIHIKNIRKDFARPTVQARNLFHVSAAMYDAWAVFDEKASPYFLGNSIGNVQSSFTGFTPTKSREEARNEAISYAAFRMILHAYINSPGASITIPEARKLFGILGYDESFTSTNYSTGSSAALGNYIASKIIEYRVGDGSNEANDYANKYYQPVNPPMLPEKPGSQTVIDPNRWQPVTLSKFIDQAGNEISNTPPFLSPEWGNVFPFALTQSELTIRTRDSHPYKIYHDPLPPPKLDKVTGANSSEYKWNFELVSAWSSHLSPADCVKIDISPNSIGNISSYPTSLSGYHSFYDFANGGETSAGYAVNPKTGLPYKPQLVYRGDYARVLAEFWADGPDSETPPGHWYTILNYVSDHPSLERKIGGDGEPVDPLEWDIKAYFLMGGAMHDAAISAWGIKGYYDYVRPITAIRYMADLGQSSDQSKPRYHPAGIELKPGLIELVEAGDPLAGTNNGNAGKIKLYCWRGPSYINNPDTDQAGVGWILAENWFPYQRPTFVTPPFAGYISGHSTYSSAAAEVLTLLTGDEYFPGGVGEFKAVKNEYLVFEEGPSTDIILQWAKYKDASDQCSLSRIWGGIHPPADDIPGRLIGKKIGFAAFQLALNYFNGIVTEVENEIVYRFDAYPNPVGHERILHLTVPQSFIGKSIVLTDVMGRNVLRHEIMDTRIHVNVDNLKPGMYIINLHGQAQTRKIIVQ